jgi:hypothetical protein
MEYIDETFEGGSMLLDGHVFRNCRFNAVLTQFHGGEVVMENCSMTNPRVQLGGDLARGLITLNELFGTEELLVMVRNVVNPDRVISSIRG